MIPCRDPNPPAPREHPTPLSASSAWHRGVSISGTIALALLLAPSRARAEAPGLYLTWNDCVGGATATFATTSTCTGTSPDQSLVAAFVLESPVDSVIAVEVVVDVQFDASAVPSWWRFEPGGCRFNRLQPSSLPPPLPTACANLWNQDLSGGLLYLVGQPHGAPNQARIVASLALPDVKSARQLSAGTMYFATRFDLLSANPTNCLGCGTSACLVLNSIRIGRTGSAGDDVVVSTPGPADANHATWQSGSANCAAVPVHGTTWGRLKGLYR